MGFLNLKNIFSGGSMEAPGNIPSSAPQPDAAMNFAPKSYCVEVTKITGNETTAMVMIRRLTGLDLSRSRAIASKVPTVFMKNLDRGDAEFVRDRMKEAGAVTAIYEMSALDIPSKLALSPYAVDQIYEENVQPVAQQMGSQQMGTQQTVSGLADAKPAGSSDAEASTDRASWQPIPQGVGNLDLEITEVGMNKVKVIKELRDATHAFGLKEAKEMVNSAPCICLRQIKEEDAQYVREKLEGVGAQVTIRESSADSAGERTIYESSPFPSIPDTTQTSSRAVPDFKTTALNQGQGEWNVEISNVGPNKVKLIKVVRELTGLGLREAKDVVDSAPCTLLRGLTGDDAEYARAQIESVAASARIY